MQHLQVTVLQEQKNHERKIEAIKARKVYFFNAWLLSQTVEILEAVFVLIVLIRLKRTP